MNIFGQTFRRLLRIPRSYGFGVQSPFAYEFVRCVVNEKYPYYAYEELYDREAVRDKTELKRCRLCLRLANYIQASSWGIALEKNQRYEKYINAGCRKTKVLTGCSADRRSELGSCQVLLMTLLDDWRPMFDSFVETATSRSVLLVMNIDVTRETRQAWRRIMKDSRTGVTFDLLDCGIVFFDLKMHKRNYKINY